MARFAAFLLPAVLAAASPATAAESVMVQCGQQYQSAKAAGTLNGMDWSQYRVDCSNRLKAQAATAVAPTAAAVRPAPVAATAPPPATPAPVPTVATAAPTARATSVGMVAMHARQKQCGAEWTSQKATLVARTPGLTWPRYWSQCNTRLKAAGR